MKSYRLMTIGALGLCSACATQLDIAHSVQVYHAAQPCCSSPADFEYQPLSKEKDTQFSITESSPAFDFRYSGGLSFFAAFALPEPGAGWLLTVESEMLGNKAAPTEPYYFYPVATFYDEQKRQLFTTGLGHIVYSEGMARNPRIEMSVRMPPKARFVVIHTTRDLIEGRTKFSLTISKAYRGSGAPGAPDKMYLPVAKTPVGASPISTPNGLSIAVRREAS